MDKLSIIGDAARYLSELEKDVEDGEADIATLMAIMQQAIATRCGRDVRAQHDDSLRLPPPTHSVPLQPCEIFKVIVNIVTNTLLYKFKFVKNTTMASQLKCYPCLYMGTHCY